MRKQIRITADAGSLGDPQTKQRIMEALSEAGADAIFIRAENWGGPDRTNGGHHVALTMVLWSEKQDRDTTVLIDTPTSLKGMDELFEAHENTLTKTGMECVEIARRDNFRPRQWKHMHHIGIGISEGR